MTTLGGVIINIKTDNETIELHILGGALEAN
jgi:hypothetical protein